MHRFDYLLGDGQAQAGTVVLLGGEERFEYTLHIFRLNPYTGIGKSYPDGVIVADGGD